jgi:DNA-binding NarL/FixJ family response regulator
MNETRRPQVLLADDYPSLNSALTRLLTSACDVVGQAVDGLEAVESARRLQPDVVVLDVLMPGLNGLDACRAIKSAAPRAHVIVITAADDADLLAQALEAGAAALIHKFRVATDLLPAIQGLMTHPPQHRPRAAH